MALPSVVAGIFICLLAVTVSTTSAVEVEHWEPRQQLSLYTHSGTTVQAWESVSSDLYQSLAQSPDGKHVYVLNHVDSQLLVVNKNTTTGELSTSSVQALPVTTDLRSQWRVGPFETAHGDIKVSPDGLNVYVSTFGDTHPSVLVYVRDAASGALTHIQTASMGAYACNATSLQFVNGTCHEAYDSTLAVSKDNRMVYAAFGSMRHCITTSFRQFKRNLTHMTPGTPHLGSTVDYAQTEPVSALIASSTSDNQNLYVVGPVWRSCTRNGNGVTTSITSAQKVRFLTYERASNNDNLFFFGGDKRLELDCNSADIGPPFTNGSCYFGLVRDDPSGNFLYAVPRDYNNTRSSRLAILRRDLPSQGGRLLLVDAFDVTSRRRNVDAALSGGTAPRFNPGEPLVKGLCVTEKYAFFALETRYTTGTGELVPLYLYDLVVYSRDPTSGNLTFHESLPGQMRLADMICNDDYVYSSNPFGLRSYERQRIRPMFLKYASSRVVYTKNSAIDDLTASWLGGAPTAFTSSPPLPAGLSLDQATGTLSGTPTELAVDRSFMIIASNNGGTSSFTLQIQVNDQEPICTLPASAYVLTVGQFVSTAAPVRSSGGQVTGYSINPTTPLPPGLTLNPRTGVVSGTALRAGEVQVQMRCEGQGTIQSNEMFLIFPISPITPSVTYEDVAPTYFRNVAVLNYPRVLKGKVDSYGNNTQLPAGLALDPATGLVSGTPTEIGFKAMDIVVKRGVFTLTVGMTFTVVDLPPTLASYAQEDAVYEVGVPIQPNTVRALGGAFTAVTLLSPSSLPSGLSINVNGSIVGTPSTVQTSTGYIIEVRNSGGATRVLVHITVIDKPLGRFFYLQQAPVYTASTIITENFPFFTGTATPTKFTVFPSLPVGLQLSEFTGKITGTPFISQVPAAAFTVTAHCSSGNQDTVLFIRINQKPPLSLTYTKPVETYAQGSAIAQNVPIITPSGIVISSYSIQPPLPPGIEMDGIGNIQGTPTSLLPAQIYTVTACNTGGCQKTQLTLAVADNAPQQLSYPVTNVEFGVGEFVILVPSIPFVVRSYAVSPPLPFGLSIDLLNGTITGRPVLAVLPAVYTVTATNTGGSTTTNIRIAVVRRTSDLPIPLQYRVMDATYYRYQTIDPNIVLKGAYEFFFVEPALPSGLALDYGTGVISGTPAVLTNRTAFTIDAAFNLINSSVTIYMTILDVPPDKLEYAQNPVKYTLGQPVAPNPPYVSVGNITKYSVLPALPAGLLLNESTGIVYGTPQVLAKPLSYWVTGSNTGGTTYNELVISVQQPPPTSIIYAKTTLNFSGSTNDSVAAPTVLGGPVQLFYSEPTMPPGIYLDNATGSVSGQPLAPFQTGPFEIYATNEAGYAHTSLLLVHETFNISLSSPDVSVTIVDAEDSVGWSASLASMILFFLILVVALVIFARFRTQLLKSEHRHKQMTGSDAYKLRSAVKSYGRILALQNTSSVADLEAGRQGTGSDGEGDGSSASGEESDADTAAPAKAPVSVKRPRKKESKPAGSGGPGTVPPSKSDLQAKLDQRLAAKKSKKKRVNGNGKAPSRPRAARTRHKPKLNV